MADASGSVYGNGIYGTGVYGGAPPRDITLTYTIGVDRWAVVVGPDRWVSTTGSSP